MKTFYGMAAAIALAGMSHNAASIRIVDDYPPAPKPVEPRRRVHSGPITDTTPESKRAKRRRLARVALTEQKG